MSSRVVERERESDTGGRERRAQAADGRPFGKNKSVHKICAFEYRKKMAPLLNVYFVHRENRCNRSLEQRNSILKKCHIRQIG